PAGFQDIEEADDVAVNVGMGIFEAVANARLGGEVDDAVELIGGEASLHRHPVAEIGPDEAVASTLPARRLLQKREPGFLQRRIVIVVDNIEANDLVAPLD